MTSPFNRTAIYISLGLALAMVVGVIFGAKFVFENTERAPVVISDLPSELASSKACTDLVDSLPEKFMGHPRAQVAEPVPAGVAAWATLSDKAVTLRCGIDMPYQYTEYSELDDIDGTAWLKVKDMTPGSDLTTWYTADRFPVVAITAHDERTPKGLDGIAKLEQAKQETYPAPLADLKPADAAVADAECSALEAAWPESLAEGYARRDDAPAHTAVWTAKGREAIVVRCGVAPPPGYEAGERLTQIDAVPWFEDTTLASGTTASTWFALGRATDVAVHVPQDVAQDVLVELTSLIADKTGEQ